MSLFWTKAYGEELCVKAPVKSESESEVMTKVVEEVCERFGHFHDAECHAMKLKFILMGDGDIGRVPLADFHKTSIDDNTFEFQESEGYLRELGALDDTDPFHPSAIVPNYIQSATNCIAFESLYSACCLNECEQLMSHPEKEIDAPEAESSCTHCCPCLLWKHQGVQLHGSLFS